MSTDTFSPSVTFVTVMDDATGYRGRTEEDYRKMFLEDGETSPTRPSLTTSELVALYSQEL